MIMGVSFLEKNWKSPDHKPRLQFHKKVQLSVHSVIQESAPLMKHVESYCVKWVDMQSKTKNHIF